MVVMMLRNGDGGGVDKDGVDENYDDIYDTDDANGVDGDDDDDDDYKGLKLEYFD